MSLLEVHALPLAEMKTHRSAKWRDFPADVLPLPVAEMDFPIATPIRDLLLEMITKSDLGYLGAIPEIGLAFAEFSAQKWNWSVDPNQVSIAGDVGIGVVEVLRLFTQPGDRVLLSSPIYHNFYTWITEVRVEKVDVPFLNTETGWVLDLATIEAEYKKGIKVHLFCNPHNPLGRVFTRDELLTLANLAHEYGVVIISDEIHAPLTYKESEFIPFLSLGPIAQSVAVTITAASKAWNIAGLKCAVIITQDPAMEAILKTIPPATHYRASLLGGFATAMAFSQGNEWLEAAVRTLDFNRYFLKELLEKAIPEIKYRVPNCSYLAWLDMSALNLGDDPAATLLERGRVGLIGGRAFSPDAGQFVRLNFATSQEVLTEAVERIAKAL